VNSYTNLNKITFDSSHDNTKPVSSKLISKFAVACEIEAIEEIHFHFIRLLKQSKKIEISNEKHHTRGQSTVVEIEEIEFNEY